MMKMSSASTPNLTPITLRFGVFFDGTGNNQHNAMTMGEQGDKGGSYGNALSNVALLHALYPAEAANAEGPQAFLKHYVEGVGTLAGEADHVYASATGHGRTGAEARVAEALQGMAEQLQAWRQAHPQATLEGVEFDLFGFSRGAAAVRHLANLLHEGAGGLLSVACETSINFIGLFDTVAAIIAPLQGDFDPADGRHGGLRLGLGAGIARHVVQLVAEDERRHNFPLVRSGHDILLPGVHSNIGGGLPGDLPGAGAAVQAAVPVCACRHACRAVPRPCQGERLAGFGVCRYGRTQAARDDLGGADCRWASGRGAKAGLCGGVPGAASGGALVPGVPECDEGVGGARGCAVSAVGGAG